MTSIIVTEQLTDYADFFRQKHPEYTGIPELLEEAARIITEQEVSHG